MEHHQNIRASRPYHGRSQKSVRLGLCLAAIGWSMGCAEPATPRRITLDQIQQQVAARNKFAWVGDGHNKALAFIYDDMKKGGKYHSPEKFCGALKKAINKYYEKHHPAQAVTEMEAQARVLDSCGKPSTPPSGTSTVFAPSRTLLSPGSVTYNLVDTVQYYPDLSANAKKLLSKIDYYVSLNGSTEDIANALASVDATANSQLSAGTLPEREAEIVLGTSSGTVSSSAYWEANMYSWAEMYLDTTSAPTQYSIMRGSVQQPLKAGFGLTAPTGAMFAGGWGSCWGYVTQSACNAAKAIVGADVAGFVSGAVSTWYAALGGPVGWGVIAGAGLARSAGTSAAAGGAAVILYRFLPQ